MIVCTGSITTFDQETLGNGLLLSLVGMGLVFVVLTVLAVAIKGFDLVESMLPNQARAAAPAVLTRREPAPVAAPRVENHSVDAEIAAAIAVSLALAEEASSAMGTPTVSRHRTSTESSWIATGRARVLAGRLAGGPARGRLNR